MKKFKVLYKIYKNINKTIIEKENIKNSEKDDIFTENIGCYHENQMVQLLYWKIKFSISN